MASTYSQRWGDQPGQSRRRTGSMLLAILAHVLIILLLLRLAPMVADHERSGAALKTFQVAGQKAATTATKHAKAVPRHSASAAAAKVKPWAQPSKQQIAAGDDASAIWALGKGLFKGSDIAAIPSAKQGETETADAGGGGAGDSHAAGAGPGGRLLYNAEWYVEPSEAEMRTYLPPNVTGWAEVMCQTAPRYRVENCRELGGSPPGSGLARAVRQAAWQFKVLPPRVNGKQIMGAWIRIRFTITDAGISVRH